MLQNHVEESQSIRTNFLDMDNPNQMQIPKGLNTHEQNIDKNSTSGTSISSHRNKKNRDSYINLINKIKLNYNLSHPKQRIQTIILHSNLDKSMNISDSSMNENLKNKDLSGNKKDNLNMGFTLDNSGHYTTNDNRKSINYLNRANMEQLIKGQEEEKNNQSAETKKNLINYNFTNDFINRNKYKNNNNKNVNINLGDIFQGINDNPIKDKALSQNNNSNFFDNKKWTNDDINDGSSNNEQYTFSSNTYKNNNFINSDFIDNKGKGLNLNYKPNNNDLSTNINTNSSNDDNNIQFRNNKNNNEKEVISSFNSGISNKNSNISFPYLRHSSSSINNKLLNDFNNNSLNDNLGTKFTFKQQDEDVNLNRNKRNSLPQNIPHNQLINSDNNEIQEGEFLNQGERTDTKEGEIKLDSKPNEINKLINKNKLENDSEEYIEYNDIENNQQYIDYNNRNNNDLTSDEKNNNFISYEKKKYKNNNSNYLDTEQKENLSLTVSESNENETDNKIHYRKRNNLLSSFLYGLLFGSTASGIFWLKDEGTRKYFLEKMKGINFGSIFDFLKRLFSNPINFFKKLFSDERMKDYIKVFGITVGKFFDIFENYNDWFRLIGIVLCVYLIWILIKSFIRAFLSLWKDCN